MEDIGRFKALTELKDYLQRGFRKLIQLSAPDERSYFFTGHDATEVAILIHIKNNNR